MGVLMNYMNLREIKINTPLPQWLQEMYAFIETVDAHDHSEGKGKRLHNNSLLIDDNIDFRGYSVDNTTGFKFDNVPDPEEVPDYSLFFYGGEFWVSTDKYKLQLTLSGSFNLALVGGLAGDYGGDNFIYYDDVAETFYFNVQNSPADIKVKGIHITGYNPVNSVYVTVQEDELNTEWTFPSDDKEGDRLIQIDSTGQLDFIEGAVGGNFFVKVDDNSELVYEPINLDFIQPPLGSEYEPLRYDSSGSVKIGSNEPILFPKGNTLQRPLDAPIGSLRYNLDTSSLEVYKGDWQSLIFLSESGVTLNNLSDTVINPESGDGVLKYNFSNSRWEVEEFTDIDFETQISGVPTNVTDLSLHSIEGLSDVYPIVRIGSETFTPESKTDLIYKYFEADASLQEGFYLSPNISGDVGWSGVTGDIRDQKDVFNRDFTSQDWDLEGFQPGLFNFRISEENLPYEKWLTGFPEPWVSRDEGSIFDFWNVVPSKEELSEGDTLYSVSLAQEGKPNVLGLNNSPIVEGEGGVNFTQTNELLTHNGVSLTTLLPPEGGNLAILTSNPTTETGLRWVTNEPSGVDTSINLGKAIVLTDIDNPININLAPLGVGETPVYDIDIEAKINLTTQLDINQGEVVISLDSFNIDSKWSSLQDLQVYVGDKDEELILPTNEGVTSNDKLTISSLDDRIFFKFKGTTIENFNSLNVELKTAPLQEAYKYSPLSFIDNVNFSNTSHYSNLTLKGVGNPFTLYTNICLVDLPYVYIRTASIGLEGETAPGGGHIHPGTEFGECRFYRINLTNQTVNEIRTFTGHSYPTTGMNSGSDPLFIPSAGYNPIVKGKRLAGSNYLYYSGLSNVAEGGFLVWGRNPPEAFNSIGKIDMRGGLFNIGNVFYRDVVAFDSQPSSVAPSWASTTYSRGAGYQSVFPQIGYKTVWQWKTGIIGFRSTRYSQRYDGTGARQFPKPDDVLDLLQSGSLVTLIYREGSRRRVMIPYIHGGTAKQPPFDIKSPIDESIISLNDCDINLLNNGVGAITVANSPSFKGIIFHLSPETNLLFSAADLHNYVNENRVFVEDTQGVIPENPSILHITYTPENDIDKIYIREDKLLSGDSSVVVINYSDIAEPIPPEGEARVFIRRSIGG